MKPFWSQWGAQFNVLTQRERLMIAGAALMVIAALLYFPLESLLLKRDTLQRQVSAMTTENKVSMQQIELYQQRLAQDPDQEYRQRLTTLEQQLADIDQQLSFQMVDMVPAEHMPAMLSQLLGQIKGVKLHSFDTLAPQPLLPVGDQDKLNLYSHGIKLTFVGDYFATLKFVQAVENMPNKLYWKQLDYSVDKHPKASVVLELYTLSINKDFISVAK